MSEHEHEYQLDVQGGFYYCGNCSDEWTIQDLLKECIISRKRIKALEGVVHWLVEMFTDSDDMLLSELCICENDPSLDIYMQCPICSENSPLYKALEDARKKLEEV